jgi:CRP-like cAMP-binding protein
MNKFIEAFGSMVELPDDVESAFLSIAEKKEISGKQLLHPEGKPCMEIYFIEKGVARTFYYRDGKDITYWIAAENEFIGAMASFFSGTPSNKSVETLEDSVLWAFNYHKLESLYSASREFERMGRLFACYGITLMEKRFDDFHFLSAKQKYEHLIQKHPRIVQRVSLGIVASYLGITQETLSRIRRQV